MHARIFGQLRMKRGDEHLARSGEHRYTLVFGEHIHRRAITAARQTILDLRERDEIGDDAFHRLEEEFDWLEMATLAGTDPESGEE